MTTNTLRRTLFKLGTLTTVALMGWIVCNFNTDAIAAAKPTGPYTLYLPYVYKPLPIDWDPRLGPGGLPHLENVRIIHANVQSGDKFWRVVKVKFEDIDESGNDHTIYLQVIDENGARVTGKKARFTGESGNSLDYPDEKPAGDLCDCNFNYPMFGDAYDVQIEDQPQFLSDTMAGMIMPLRRHVNYRITFQLTTMP